MHVYVSIPALVICSGLRGDQHDLVTIGPPKCYVSPHQFQFYDHHIFPTTYHVNPKKTGLDKTTLI